MILDSPMSRFVSGSSPLEPRRALGCPGGKMIYAPSSTRAASMIWFAYRLELCLSRGEGALRVWIHEKLIRGHAELSVPGTCL